MYATLGPLIDVSRETGTHILIVHHSGKTAKGDPIDSPLGSTALGGAVATLVSLSRKENYRIIQTRQRIGSDMPETILSFDPTTRELCIGGSRSDLDRDAVASNILEYLKTSADEKTEPEICDAVEGTNAVKRTALRLLVGRGSIRRDGTGRRGDPFKYSYARTEPIQRTAVQETECAAENCVITEEKCSYGCSEDIARTSVQETNHVAESDVSIGEKLVRPVGRPSLFDEEEI